jgi:hypothetical protein
MTPSIICGEQPAGTPPATKVPALDILDHYLATPAEDCKGFTEKINLPYCFKTSNEAKFIESYARLVSGCTGADEVAFILARGSESETSLSSISVVSAVIHHGTLQAGESLVPCWDELDLSFCQEDEIQFALDLRTSNPGDDPTLERQDVRAT